jgi:hypothetical protein
MDPILVASFPNAAKRRYDIERSGWNAHIKVDYDEKRIPMFRVKRVALFLSRGRLTVLHAEVCETRKGYHLRIWLDRAIGPYTALKAQEILGDDPMRQKFNRKRVRKHRPGWNVLFNEKWRGEKCIMREEKDDQLSATLLEMLRPKNGDQ